MILLPVSLPRCYIIAFLAFYAYCIISYTYPQMAFEATIMTCSRTVCTTYNALVYYFQV